MCTGRFRAGNGPPGVPSIQAILGEKIGGAYEIPNISGDALRPSTFRGDGQDPRFEPVGVASVEQLKGLVLSSGDELLDRLAALVPLSRIATATSAC